MNNKASIYVRNIHYAPSSYYRLVQYFDDHRTNSIIRNLIPNKLYSMKININRDKKFQYHIVSFISLVVLLIRLSYFLVMDIIKKPEFVIVSKTFLPRINSMVITILIKMITRKSLIVWDFDDNIKLSKEISNKQFQLLESLSYRIVVTNSFLKDNIKEKFHHKISILPTTDRDIYLDKEAFSKATINRLSIYDREIHIVWVGTKQNIQYIDNFVKHINSYLRNIVDNEKKIIIHIVSNGEYISEDKNIRVINHRWSREKAREIIHNAHIGIMPLNNNLYEKGKGGFKLIQYLSAGVPVIGSDVGNNRSIISDNVGYLISTNDEKRIEQELRDALMSLAFNKEQWMTFSSNAIKRWETFFSYEYNFNFWQELLNNKVGRY